MSASTALEVRLPEISSLQVFLRYLDYHNHNYHCRMCYLRLSAKLIEDIEHFKMMILTCVKEDARQVFLDCFPSKPQLHHTLILERVLIQLLIDLLICS